MLLTLLVTSLLCTSLLEGTTALKFPFPQKSHTTIIPVAPQSGPSQAQFTSSSFGLDGPKVSPINGTSWDWWYFDAVSVDKNTNASIAIIFFTATDGGFPYPFPQPAVPFVAFYVSFPNGTLFNTGAIATEAVIVTEGQGSSGDFNGTGATWKGATDLSTHVVTVDSTELGVHGSLVLKSNAPAHYTCAPVGTAGSDMQIFPHVGWANAVPDSIATADFTVLGTKLKFVGAGYHSKNWGDKPFVQNIQSYYWGHARLGPYSIVWFDGIGSDGVERTGAYAARSGKIVTVACQHGLQVRPSGANSTYPPTQSSGNPQGFHVDLDLGKEGKLAIDVDNQLVIAEVGNVYTRWVGEVVGTLNSSKKTWKGVSLQEEFRFLP